MDLNRMHLTDMSLFSDDDETVNTIPERRAFQPLWESRRRHDLRHV